MSNYWHDYDNTALPYDPEHPRPDAYGAATHRAEFNKTDEQIHDEANEKHSDLVLAMHYDGSPESEAACIRYYDAQQEAAQRLGLTQ